MALTPEDIVNKRFQSTKFREGYDQDEVDDFLDEVVVEMRRVAEENTQLKNELQAAEARIAELQRSGATAAPAAPVSTTSLDDPIDAEGTTNLLQLARRLHEEHVREGIQKRESSSLKATRRQPASSQRQRQSTRSAPPNTRRPKRNSKPKWTLFVNSSAITARASAASSKGS